MKIIKAFILFVLISLIVGVGDAFSTPLENFDIERITSKSENNETIEENDVVHEEIINEETKIEEKYETPVVAETKKETPIVKEESKQTKKQESKSISSDSKQETVMSEVKKNPWEELGMSEDEYYNEPIMKWQKITHPDMDACKIEGQKTIDDENNEFVSFWCYEVYSPSGKFLGAMLSLT